MTHELRPIVVTPSRIHYVLVDDSQEVGSMEIVTTNRGAEVVWTPDDDTQQISFRLASP